MRYTNVAQRALYKLKNRTGEALVETLVSILVGSLSLLVLATAIGSSVHIIMTSRARMQDFFGAETSMVLNTGTRSSGNVTLELGVPINPEHGRNEVANVYEPDGAAEDIRLYERGTP